MGYLELFGIFFKIGLFTIGGGYAMIPMIERELVDIGAIGASEIYNLIAISQMTPGAFALNSATFCGTRILGVGGGIVATLGVVMPSLIITTVVAIFFYKVKETNSFKVIFSGLKPVAIGLILTSILKMILEDSLGMPGFDSFSSFIESASMINFDPLKFFTTIAIAIVSAFVIIKFKVHPVLIVLGCAVLGILIFGFI